MSSVERIEELFEERLGVGATAVKIGSKKDIDKLKVIVSFSYSPVSKDVLDNWKLFLRALTESSVVKLKGTPPKREGGEPHFRIEFERQSPPAVLEYLKRALPTDSRIVPAAPQVHWGFQPKNITVTRGDYGEGRYDESESI